MTNEQYVNHEVRMQLVENAIIKMGDEFSSVGKRFNNLDDEMKDLRKEMRSDFKWLMGSILGLSAIMIGFLGSIALHAAKLT
jgi:hypothetical protein